MAISDVTLEIKEQIKKDYCSNNGDKTVLDSYLQLCATDDCKKKIIKYWGSIPLRLAKLSVKNEKPYTDLEDKNKDSKALDIQSHPKEIYYVQLDQVKNLSDFLYYFKRSDYSFRKCIDTLIAANTPYSLFALIEMLTNKLCQTGNDGIRVNEKELIKLQNEKIKYLSSTPMGEVISTIIRSKIRFGIYGVNRYDLAVQESGINGFVETYCNDLDKLRRRSEQQKRKHKNQHEPQTNKKKKGITAPSKFKPTESSSSLYSDYEYGLSDW